MWDEVDEGTGATREGELKNNYWKSMIARGSSTGRFTRTPESAFRLITPLLDEANRRNGLLIQKELVDLDLRLSETHAGQRLRSEIKQLVKQQQELLHEIQQELKHPSNAKSLQELMEEYEELKKTSESFLQQIADLEVPFGRQFKNFWRTG
jgi:signal transduction histidine kinase